MLVTRTAYSEMKDLPWEGYILKGYSFVEFASEIRVLDVGCGSGTQLQKLGQGGAWRSASM